MVFVAFCIYPACLRIFSDIGDVSIEVPFLGVSLPNTPVDWNYTSTRQLGAALRELHYTRGKVLGGSSCLSESTCTFHPPQHSLLLLRRPINMEHLRYRSLGSLGVVDWG